MQQYTGCHINLLTFQKLLKSEGIGFNAVCDKIILMWKDFSFFLVDKIISENIFNRGCYNLQITKFVESYVYLHANIYKLITLNVLHVRYLKESL